MRFFLLFFFCLPLAQADYIWLRELGRTELELETKKPLHGIYQGLSEDYRYYWQPQTEDWQWWQSYADFPAYWVEFMVHEFDRLEDIANYDQRMEGFLAGDSSVDFSPSYYFTICLKAYAKYEHLALEPEAGISEQCIARLKTLLTKDRSSSDFLDPEDPDYEQNIKNQYITYEAINGMYTALELSENDLNRIPIEELDSPNQAPYGFIVDPRLSALKAFEFMEFAILDPIILRKMNIRGAEKLVRISAQEIHASSNAEQKTWEADIIQKAFHYSKLFYRHSEQTQEYFPHLYSQYGESRKFKLNVLRVAAEEDSPKGIEAFTNYFLETFQHLLISEDEVSPEMQADLRYLSQQSSLCRQMVDASIAHLRERVANDISTETDEILLALLEQI